MSYPNQPSAWLSHTGLAIIAGLVILAVNMGVRQSMGLLLPDMALQLQWPMAELSFAFAVQNLVWGAMAPVAGLAAERYGTGKVLAAGGLIYAAGLGLMTLSENYWIYQISNGLVIGIGIGATTFPIVLAAVGRHVSEQKRSFVLGLVSAGGSVGQFGFALLTQWSLERFDWIDTLWLMAASMLLILFFSPWLRTRPQHKAAAIAVEPLVRSDRRILLLALGFFVCGYHVAFISIHLPNLVALCGLNSEVAGNSLALIGLINVAGTLLAGWLGGRYHKPYLLSAIYGARALLIVGFMLAPKTAASFYWFSALMGMLWLSTVPLTSGTVAQYFGTARLASLFGLVMLSHQIGAFVGAWTSGIIFDLSGSYDLVWTISALLGLLAALVHLPIRPQTKLQITPITNPTAKPLELS